MANYSYTNNGIEFTLQDNDILQFSKIANAEGSLKRGEIVPLINAVEIDWNGATTEMGGQTKVINTTGELISYLATAYTNALSGGVDNDTVNSLISSYLESKIPIERYSQFPFDYTGNGYPLQNRVTIGGRISYIYPDDPNTTHTTFSTSIINLNHPLNSVGAPDNAVHTISFSYSRSNNAEPAECAYFDGNGYLHLKDLNFNTINDLNNTINEIPIKIETRYAGANQSGPYDEITIGPKYNGSTEPKITLYGAAIPSDNYINIGSSISINKSKVITAPDYKVSNYSNKLLSAILSEFSTTLSSITPADRQSGNSGYIIAYDTTTGNLFKSLATVDDTGVYFTSDISLKENVEQIIDGEIDKLFETESGNMYSFDWKDSHEHSFGFIAQELEQFAPEAVHEFDGIKKVNYEVALTKVCAAMFKKIKQLEARIDELEK